MSTFTRDCFSCRFAYIHSGTRVLQTEHGTVTQNGEKCITCTATPTSLMFTDDEMICGSWEPKEVIKG